MDFPRGPVVKNPSANAGDMDLTPGPGRLHMPQGNQARVPQPLSQHSRACKPRPLGSRAATTEAGTPTACAPQ